MATYISPFSKQDEHFDGSRPNSLSSYFNPNTFPNQSPAHVRSNSVSDYLTSSFQTQPTKLPELPRPTITTGIESLDGRFLGAASMAQRFQENNPDMLSRMPTNRGVVGNQLKNSWGELGLGGQINAAASTIGDLYQAYTGGREAKLAKAQMRFNKDAWNKEYGNAVQDVNRSLRDRQQLRNYYNPDMYGNPDDYVAKYGAK